MIPAWYLNKQKPGLFLPKRSGAEVSIKVKKMSANANFPKHLRTFLRVPGQTLLSDVINPFIKTDGSVNQLFPFFVF